MFLKDIFCCFPRKKQIADSKTPISVVEEIPAEMKKEELGVDNALFTDDLPDPLEPYLTLKKQGSELKEIYGSVDDFVYALFYLKA